MKLRIRTAHTCCIDRSIINCSIIRYIIGQARVQCADRLFCINNYEPSKFQDSIARYIHARNISRTSAETYPFTSIALYASRTRYVRVTRVWEAQRYTVVKNNYSQNPVDSISTNAHVVNINYIRLIWSTRLVSIVFKKEKLFVTAPFINHAHNTCYT